MRAQNGRGLSVAVAVMVLGIALSVVSRSSWANDVRPGANLKPRPGSVELLEKRTQNSKTFLNPDGTRTWSASVGRIHYQDRSSRWDEIDVAIRPLTDRERWESVLPAYATDQQPWMPDAASPFALDTSNFVKEAKTTLRLTPGGILPVDSFAYGMTRNDYRSYFAADAARPILARFATANWSVSFGIEDGNKGLVTISGNTITYHNAIGGADLRFITNVQELREEIILCDRPGKVEWMFPLYLEGVCMKEGKAGTIDFVDATSGERVWYIPKPFMIDAAGNRSESVSKTLKVVDGRTFLVVRAEKSWLNESQRMYPVIVDPTWDSSGTGNGGESNSSSGWLKRDTSAGTYTWKNNTTDTPYIGSISSSTLAGRIGIKWAMTNAPAQSTVLNASNSVRVNVYMNWANATYTQPTAVYQPYTGTWSGNLATWRALAGSNTDTPGTPVSNTLNITGTTGYKQWYWNGSGTAYLPTAALGIGLRGTVETTAAAYHKGFNAGVYPSGQANEPYLEIDYTTCTPPTVPGAPTVNAVTGQPTQLTVANNASDSGTDYYAFRINGGTFTNQYVQADGSVGATAVYQTKATWSTKTVTGLSANVQYTFDVNAATDDTGSCTSGFGTTAAKYTVAIVPGQPTVGTPAQTTLKVTINQNSNPATVVYSIRINGGAYTNQYVQASGAVGASEVFQTYATWGGASGVTVTGLVCETTYTFDVRARNGDNVTTAWSTTAQGTTGSCCSLQTPAAAAATNIGTDSIRWNWGENGNSCEDGYKVYDAASSGNLMATLAANTTSWTESTGLLSNTAYNRYVCAYLGTQESPRVQLTATTNSRTALENYDFENGFYTSGSDVIGNHFRKFSGVANSMSMSQETTIVRGSNSQKVTSSGTGGQDGFIGVEQDIDLPAGKLYRLQAWANLVGATNYVIVITTDATGSGAASLSSSGWNQKGSNFTANTSGKTRMRVYGARQNAANFSGPGYIDDIWLSPQEVTNGTPQALSTTSIKWMWTCDANNTQTGFRVRDDSSSNSSPFGVLKSTDLAGGATEWTESGLSANTQYHRRIHPFSTLGECGYNTAQGTPATESCYTLIQGPTGLTFGTVAQTSIQVTPVGSFANLTLGSSGVITRNTTSSTNSTWVQTTDPWISSGLTGNTVYSFQVESRNGDAVSGGTASGSKRTLAAAPSAGNNVACDKTINTPYPAGTTFTFTNPASFGDGTHGGNAYRVTKFKYVWDKNASHTWTGSETDWNSGSLPLTPNSGDGSYYLHLQSFNGDNVATVTTLDDGPFLFDGTAPTVTVNQAVGQADPTSSLPIYFSVVFSESVSDFAQGDVNFNGTATGISYNITGNGTTYQIVVTAVTTPGTVVASVGSGKAHDQAGNGNTASTSTDNSVLYSADTDGDGIADSVDNCPTVPNADQADGDSDGVGNVCDNCPNNANPGQENSDGDSAGNACDGCPNDPNKIVPGVCGCGVADTDSDGDGTPDCNDQCPNDPNKIVPGICGCSVAETDTDSDGTPDCTDQCPNDPNKTLPGVCGCGISDADSDGDGTPNCNDLCPNDPNKVDPGICGCGVEDMDTDGDGIADCIDQCPNDPNKSVPGQCGCGVADTDSDSDGTADCHDGCPNDPAKTSPGVCGCGISDADSDGDGTPNCNDGCPNDPNKTAAGQCGCGVADTDSDSDGTADCIDGCPDDPEKVAPGVCGCGVADTDSDGDGTPNCNDQCPEDPNKILPGVCGCGVADTDSDGDGTPNCNDGCPSDPNKTAPGQCGCGVADTDGDGDGVADCIDNCPTVPNPGQEDTNHNGIGDACETAAPTILSWKSERTHGSAGALSIVLDPLTAKFETRQGGVKKMLVTFDKPVQAADGSLDTGDVVVTDSLSNTYTPTAVSLTSGDTVLVIEFSSGMPDMKRYKFDLTGKFKAKGAPYPLLTGDADCEVRSLIGDVNSSGNMNLIDVGAVKSKYGVAVTASTCMYDLNATGSIDLIDVGLAKVKYGNTVP